MTRPMRTFRFVTPLALLLLPACVRQPQAPALRAVTPARLLGDTAWLEARSVPRGGEWADDVTVEVPPAANAVVFEFTGRGKARVRELATAVVHSVSSIRWREWGHASGGTPPGYSGASAGETVCRSGGRVRASTSDQGYDAPIACARSRPRPSYSPSYSATSIMETRAVLVVVADSALRLGERRALVRDFVEARGNSRLLEILANRVAPDGRWAAAIHSLLPLP